MPDSSAGTSSVRQDPDPSGPPAPLTHDDVRRVAHLARLAIADEQVESYRERLAAVISHAQRLRGLDLSGVEPMSSPTDATGVPRDDVPGPTLATETIMRLAPDALPPFIRVPRVLGDGGGA